MPFELTSPPEDERARELWLQHAAGFIVFNDMREYAIKRIPDDTDDKTREKIISGIDDAVYGLMMIMDGVTGFLRNDEYTVSIKNKIRLQRGNEVMQEIDTLDGDGMCMGYHGWKDGDFGDDAICRNG
jgi:hypothetical protein